jgi:hypothetical protein
MTFFGMWRRADLVRTDVSKSEEPARASGCILQVAKCRQGVRILTRSVICVQLSRKTSDSRKTKCTEYRTCFIFSTASDQDISNPGTNVASCTADKHTSACRSSCYVPKIVRF